MGCWGMGVAQSDDYCEVYERFMEEYDRGKPISDIKADILEDYLIEFDENDAILHDMYFAIGKAEWMCGGISADIFEKISHIVRSGENIAFLRELEATESDLKLRKKNLKKFLAALSVPRGIVRKRKIPMERYVEVKKPKPPFFRCGDVFAYPVDGKYRLLCLVARKKMFDTYAAYCYVWAKLYEQIPALETLRDEEILPLGYFMANSFPKIEALQLVGNSSDMLLLDLTYPSHLYRPWKQAEKTIAKEENLSETYPAELCVKLSDCLKKIQELRRGFAEYRE